MTESPEHALIYAEAMIKEWPLMQKTIDEAMADIKGWKTEGLGKREILAMLHTGVVSAMRMERVDCATIVACLLWSLSEPEHSFSA